MLLISVSESDTEIMCAFWAHFDEKTGRRRATVNMRLVDTENFLLFWCYFSWLVLKPVRTGPMLGILAKFRNFAGHFSEIAHFAGHFSFGEISQISPGILAKFRNFAGHFSEISQFRRAF